MGHFLWDGPYASLMDAIRKNRVYATEDDELAVAFQVNFAGKNYWMGETVPIPSERVDVEVTVFIAQAEGSDGDDVDEGKYTVTVFSDSDGIGRHEASVWSQIEDVPSGAPFKFPLEILADEYIYLRITEQGGKDNPVGDGVDEVNNETGAHGADGKRDDMNDSAWTTPIWFTQVAP
jgi:hypothetical protein